MITASQAQELTGYNKAMAFIEKNIRKAATNGENEYVYTTDMKAKANQIVKALKAADYDVRFIHTPNGKREHKIIVNW